MVEFNAVITPCTLTYRFVHTPGRDGNSPEMLGVASPESEGFSAQLTRGNRGPVSRHSHAAEMCEDPDRILAMVQ